MGKAAKKEFKEGSYDSQIEIERVERLSAKKRVSSNAEITEGKKMS